MLSRDPLIDVVFVIVPHSLLLDVAGPAEAFRLANQHRGRRGLPPRYRLRFAAPGETLTTSVGLTIANLEPLPAELTGTTWVVVVGQPSEHLGIVTPAVTETAQWLHRRVEPSE
jgi:transcriptional regulator GlxA family with amidase domain